MTTEEKKTLCENCAAPHANKQELELFGCWQCGKKPTPPETGKVDVFDHMAEQEAHKLDEKIFGSLPETGREWEEQNKRQIWGIIDDWQDDKMDFKTMLNRIHFVYEEKIRSVASTARAEGAKAERERIKKLVMHELSLYDDGPNKGMWYGKNVLECIIKDIDALKGTL